MRTKSAFFFAAAMLALAIPALAGTEMPFEFSHNLIWIKVKTAGREQPLNFLLDTGAGSTVLNLETAKELRLEFGNSETVQGVNSRSVARWVGGFDASASGIPLRKSLLAVNLSAASCSCEKRIDGLLGADFLQGRVVQIDYAAKKIRLLDHREPPPANAQILPIRTQSDGLCVPVEVCGNKAQWMRLDTGCDEPLHWVINRSDNLKGLVMLSIGLFTGPVRYARASVDLGNQHFSDIKAGVQEKPIFAGESGLLGNGLLSKFKVTIDMPRRVLILEKYSP